MPAVIHYDDANLEKNLILRVTFSSVDDDWHRCAYVVKDTATLPLNIERYGCVILPNFSFVKEVDSSNWLVLKDISSLKEDDVIQIYSEKKRIRFLYEPGVNGNALFVTDCCNSHCIMCPQPPKDVNSIAIQDLFDTVCCLPETLEDLGITGGEPTLLGSELINLVKEIGKHCPSCHIHILSNARKFCNYEYARQLADAAEGRVTIGIPLYASDPEVHDFIVQQKGAFDEAINGILNLAKCNIGVEIRMVLHKQTVSQLLEFSHYIYRNLPFVYHVAFMGMEHMGFVKKNKELLWISPVEYQGSLLAAIRYLFLRGVNCSIYNLPYCLLDRRLWKFAKDSISDFKKSFPEECLNCIKKDSCSGVFFFQQNDMSLRSIQE